MIEMQALTRRTENFSVELDETLGQSVDRDVSNLTIEEFVQFKESLKDLKQNAEAWLQTLYAHLGHLQEFDIKKENK